MRSGVPWSVAGIAPEAREAARIAAQKAGLSLADWLNQTILDSAGEVPLGPEQQMNAEPPRNGSSFARDDRLESGWGYDRPEHRTGYYEQPQAQPANYAPPPEPTHYGPPPPHPSHSQSYPPQNDVLRRIESMEARNAHAISQIDRAVNAIAQRLDANDRLKSMSDTAMSTAAEALNVATREQSNAFGTLEKSFGSLLGRVERIERDGANAASQETLRSLEQSLGASMGALQNQVERAERRTAESAGAVSFTLQTLTDRLNGVDERKTIAEREQAERVARLGHEHGHELKVLGERVAAMETRTGEAASSIKEAVGLLLQKYEAEYKAREAEVRQHDAEIKAQSLEVRQHGLALDDVRGAVRMLSERAETSAQREAAIFAKVEAKLEEQFAVLSARLEPLTQKVGNGADASSGRFEAVEEAVEQLTQKFSAAERRSGETASTVEQALKGIGSRVESVEKRHKESLGGLQSTLDEVLRRLDSMDSGGHTSAHFDGGTSSFGPPPPPASAASAAFAQSRYEQQGHASDFAPPPYEPQQHEELPPYLRDQGGDGIQPPDPHVQGPSRRPDDFIAQARRAAQAAAHGEPPPAGHIEPSMQPGAGFDARAASRAEARGKYIRVAAGLVGAAVFAAGIVYLLNMKSGDRPAPGSSIGEYIAPTTTPAAPTSRPLPEMPFSELPPAPPITAPQPETTAPATGGTRTTIDEDPGETVATAEPETEEPVAPPAPRPTAPTTTGPTTTGPTTTAPTATAPTTTAPAPAPSAGPADLAALQQAAQKGDARAQYLLSLRYAEGTGVTQSDQLAAQWMSKAAAQGLPMAQYRLGVLYERGKGVPRDLGAASEWYEKAATNGNRKAMHNLAVLFAEGGLGQPDYTQAARWFQAGADLGLKDSQYNLAILFERGLGVQVNLIESYRWYAAAAGQGDADAKSRLTAIEAKLTPDDLARAKQAAAAFRAKPMNRAANETPTFTTTANN